MRLHHASDSARHEVSSKPKMNLCAGETDHVGVVEVARSVQSSQGKARKKKVEAGSESGSAPGMKQQLLLPESNHIILNLLRTKAHILYRVNSDLHNHV